MVFMYMECFEQINKCGCLNDFYHLISLINGSIRIHVFQERYM